MKLDIYLTANEFRRMCEAKGAGEGNPAPDPAEVLGIAMMLGFASSIEYGVDDERAMD